MAVMFDWTNQQKIRMHMSTENIIFLYICKALSMKRGNSWMFFIGYPGSVHDARVFANSPLADDLPTLYEGGGHVLGDSTYPCLPQLITPYKDNGHLTRAQKSFNRVHSSCRIIVEHAFGCLKQWFRQLYHFKMREMQRVVQLIHACCILHNLADEVDLSHLEPLGRDDHPD
ncbi:hypothetical protein PR048_010699 [Dryococelus australis]|uniref:DDE Tnp4 domain-containing protein n=1 Tax=Dryococelus australis TaxID=614101 RepID=A0ABQ9I3F2_9NEOP|nr:hypothetical protein PR048_010699 [Dryococelus australis]